ncbi:TraM recognition site of TraD and TraG [compost metagenome]
MKLNFGRFKAHPMTLYDFAPNLEMDYKRLDVLTEALHSVYNDSILKDIREGQEAISLELLGEDKRSSYVLGFPDRYRTYLVDRIKYTYRGSGIVVREHDIRPFPSEHTLCCSLTLRHHPFRALQLALKGEFTSHLLNAYDGLEEKERAWIQILIEPMGSDWADECWDKYNAYLQGEEVINGVGVGMVLAKGIKALSDIPRNIAKDAFSQQDEARKGEKLKSTELKLRQQAFRVSVRIAIQAPSDSRRSTILMGIVNAFRSMNDSNEWRTASVFRKEKFLEMMLQRKMPAFDSTVILCRDEVKGFWQMPTKDMDAESITQMTPEETSVSPLILKSGIQIGNVPIFGGDGPPVYIPVDNVDDAAKVRLWISSPGGGKSTQIEFFTEGAAQHGHGFAVYDGKDGVMFHRVLSTLSRTHNEERFAIIDYENEQRPPIFNFNALGAEGQSAGSMFVELFELIFKGQSLITSKSFAVKCAQAVFTDPQATFLEFIMMMRDEDFRKTIIPRIRSINPDLYLWWRQEFPKISNDELNRMCRPILDRIENDVLYNQTMGRIICGRGGRIAYSKWMEEGKMVFVNAPLGFFSEPELRLIMALHNFASWNATLSRRKITQTGKRARLFHLLYDEPQNYMDATPTIQTAIAKARAYSVSYNFFIQEAEQIMEKAPALWKTILGMSPALMVGAVSENTARQLKAELGISTEDILRVKELPYHWWYRGYADKAAVRPVIIKSLTPIDIRKPPLPLVDRRVLKFQNAQHFGSMTREQIDEDITARHYKLSVEDYRRLLRSYAKDDSDEEGVEWGTSEEAGTPDKK